MSNFVVVVNTNTICFFCYNVIDFIKIKKILCKC